jgi:WD40 repeat protein/tRNA A-37 threonylcarbamoyl transferase component Bud32
VEFGYPAAEEREGARRFVEKPPVSSNSHTRPPAAPSSTIPADRGTASGGDSVADGGRAEGDESLPEQFGRYRIVRLLGQGAMGSVYLAHDAQLDRQVALKVPKFSATGDEQLIERFYREARAAATIRHPNLCPIHDVGEIEGRPFLTMAFIEGRPLSDYVRPGKPLPERQAAALVRKLARGLAAAHEKNVTHRDLKPANIMIDERSEPIVMDFGLAQRERHNEPQLTQAGALLGTPAYMPPEQVLGETGQVGPPADIYSLGVVLYELLTGDLPFQGPVTAVLGQVLHVEPPPPSSVRPDLDADLEAICLRAMAKSIDARFASMAEFADALKSYLLRAMGQTGKGQTTGSTESSAAAPETAATIVEQDTSVPPAETRTGGRRLGRRGIAAFAGMAIVAAVAVGAYVVDRNRRNPEVVAPVPPPLAAAPDVLPPGEVRQFVGHTRAVWDIAFSPDGKQLLTAAGSNDDSDDNTARLWDVETGAEIHLLGGHSKRLSSVVFSPDGRQALSGGLDGTMRLWDLVTGEQLQVMRLKESYGRTCRVKFDSTGQRAASIIVGKGIERFSTADGRRISEAEGRFKEQVLGITFAASGSAMLFHLDNHRWMLMDGPGRPRAVPLLNGLAGVQHVFFPGNARVLTVMNDGMLLTWDAATLQEVKRVKSDAMPGTALALAPDGMRLLIATGLGRTRAADGEAEPPSDYLLQLWDVGSGRLLHAYAGHTSTITDVEFSPDGRLAASCSMDASVRLWRMPAAVAASASE